MGPLPLPWYQHRTASDLISFSPICNYNKYAMTWEDIAADKRRRIDASIPDEWRIDVTKFPGDSVMHVPAASGILSPQELEITSSSAVDLASRLASGQLKSVDVTLAFCKRAALAHQLVCFKPADESG